MLSVHAALSLTLPPRAPSPRTVSAAGLSDLQCFLLTWCGLMVLWILFFDLVLLLCCLRVATTSKSGLPPTPTVLRIRGRHRTAWLARMLLWYYLVLFPIIDTVCRRFSLCGGGVRHSSSPQTSILLLPPVVLTAVFFSNLSCSATASGWFRKGRWLRTVPRRHVARVGKSRERLSF